MPQPQRQAVSFDDEPLILVDTEDRELGFMSKVDCHQGRGLLHRAFSIFLFDDDGRVLLQRRSASKPLWPLYWSNSCCSHPRRGEALEQAASRRLVEELGVQARLHHLYRFIYQADYLDIGAEHELCHVYIARLADGEVRVHPDEVAEIEWVSFGSVADRMAAEPERYTPWFRLEWNELMNRHRPAIDRLLATS